MTELQVDSTFSIPQAAETITETPKISPIEPDTHYLENISGLTNRIEAVIVQHFGNDLPILHFTNAEVGNQLDKLISTGFLERFLDEGSVKKIHVGAFRKQEEIRGPFRDLMLGVDNLSTALQKLRKITEQFYHHGLRTNKNQLKSGRGATFSLPAAIIMEKPDKLERGTDNYDHWITTDSQGKEKILAIIKFNPRRATNWVTLKRTEENAILKEIIHGLGTQRLQKISQSYNAEPDLQKKNDLALYAHDLVDSYLVGQEEFDVLFKDISESTRKSIVVRREKYKLFQKPIEQPV